MPVTHTRIPLPESFDRDTFLDFHRRDGEGTAERVDGQTLIKGLSLDGPAMLTVRFRPRSVQATLDAPGLPPSPAPLVRHLLGLDQPVEAFEQRYARHRELGRLLKTQSGLRIPQCATPFEALSWAIIGQQISVRAAVAIRRRFIVCFGPRLDNGLYCYPSPDRLANASVADLKSCGFSVAKAETLCRVVQACRQSGLLPIPGDEATDEALRERLLAIKGLGPWSVNYALLRGYADLDGSLHGDVAVRKALQRLLRREQPMSARDTEQWLAGFSPWRALVAAHLWRSLSLSA
ncbi:MAG: 3-methyladenine DNA glycosylase 2 [Pseudomonadales bacterium]|nr:3-methyladenine DNA glycosylase 2 [Pseudomonadales bacterium]